MRSEWQTRTIWDASGRGAIARGIRKLSEGHIVHLLRAMVIVLVTISSALGQGYTVRTFAGGYLPDNIPGVSASVGDVKWVNTDSAGNVFFSSELLHTVFRLDATGVVTRVAGKGAPGFSGDGGPAGSAQLSSPAGVAMDAAGNLCIADRINNRIRKVSNGVITTVAGDETSRDNAPATRAGLSSPSGVALDAAGNLYIADTLNYRIRKVSNGVISTVAGNGTSGFSGDDGPATSAQLNFPYAITVDAASNLYILDSFNNRIRKVSNGVITTMAGDGTSGFGGDNGPATSARLGLSLGRGVAVDAAGNLYIADYGNSRIRKVSNGVIDTVVTPSVLNGDAPSNVAVDAAGSLYVATAFGNRILKATNGAVTTVAGNGTASFSGDGGLATSAQMGRPTGVAVDSAGTSTSRTLMTIRRLPFLTSMRNSSNLLGSTPTGRLTTKS